jgi:hypothetical protein
MCTSVTIVCATDGIVVVLSFEKGRFVDFAILQERQLTFGCSNSPMA